MNAALNHLQSLLTDGLVLGEETVAVDTEGLLALRHNNVFESEWLRVHESLRLAVVASSAERSIVDSIRELAFKRVFNAVQDPDLAAYVSDDFGLIASGLVVGLDDPWLNRLWTQYQSGTIPRGDIGHEVGHLADLILAT